MDEQQLWAFEKYELVDHLFVNIGVDLDERYEEFGTVFFCQNYQRPGRLHLQLFKYRKIPLGDTYLPNLSKLVDSINHELKQNGVVGSSITSFLRKFVIELTRLKTKHPSEFQLIWQQLQRLNVC